MFKNKEPPATNPRLRQASITELFSQYKRKKSNSGTSRPATDSIVMETTASTSSVTCPPADSENNGMLPPTSENDNVKKDVCENKAPSSLMIGYTHDIIQPIRGHFVLFKVSRENWSEDHELRPHPTVYYDFWDQEHVRMPCSLHNLIPMDDTLHGRWALIQTALLNDISSSYDIEEAILCYNPQYSQLWDFKGLHNFFQKIEIEERDRLLSVVVPGMAQLALQLPSLVTQAPPLLKQSYNQAISMTQTQVACLLANAFFCTFPRRNVMRRRGSGEYLNFPDINFQRLFIGRSQNLLQLQRRQMKLKAIFHYFSKILKNKPNGILTFYRQCLKEFPNWAECTDPLVPLKACQEGRIEKEGAGMLQVDFANSFVGGGVLGLGCVQEEIRFLICPELLVTRLFTERLGPTEVLLMKGCEQFSNYSGYGDTFTWEGDFQDQTPRDVCGRRETEIVAMDALHFHMGQDQYQQDKMERELHKSYCGFFAAGQTHPSAVATGNWGCGAFGGDPELKSLLQWMAASAAHRSGVTYFTFHNGKLKEDLTTLASALQGCPVSRLWNLLLQFCSIHKTSDSSLFSFLFETLQLKASPDDGDEDNQ